MLGLAHANHQSPEADANLNLQAYIPVYCTQINNSTPVYKATAHACNLKLFVC